MADKNEPYVGPRPFTREDKSLFFGRDREADDLLSLIIAHPVVLIYSQSGAGKTSLLNAKVIPLLEAENSVVFGPTRVSGQLFEGIDPGQVKNIFVYNSLQGLQSDASNPQKLIQSTFGDFLSANPNVPKKEGLSNRRVFVFDQFEEIFTSFTERWNDRRGFFDSIGEALESDRSLRVVFAMREEYLASIEPYANLLIERLRTRFRLERLREDAALLAVTNPLTTTNRSFEPGAAKKLVDSLLKVPIKSATGETREVLEEFIEPVQLQVVCQNLWQKLPPDVNIIGEKYIQVYGDVDQALSSYYDSCIKKVAAESQLSEGKLRRWFGNQLITPDGTRGTVYSDNKEAGKLPIAVVKLFENVRLVRPEMRGGVPWYELTHDRFIVPIKLSNQEWMKQRDTGFITSQSLERKAQEWISHGRKGSDLLIGLELSETRHWMSGIQAQEIDVTEQVKDFVRASESSAKQKRLRQILAVSAILLLVSVGIIIYAYRAKKAAEDAKYIQSGEVAIVFSAQKRPFDALIWGIKGVAPRVKKGSEPPDQALDGLREALRVMGERVWLRGLSSPVDDFSISRDGKLIVASNKSEVLIWDTHTVTEPRRIRSADVPLKHRGSSADEEQTRRWNMLTISPDGKKITARFFPDSNSKEPSEIFFWNAETGQPLSLLQEKVNRLYPYGVFSNDGSHVLLLQGDTKNFTVHIADAETGEQRGTLQRQFTDLKNIGFSDTDKNVLSVEADKLQLWDSATGKLSTSIKLKADQSFRPYYALSADSKFVVVRPKGASAFQHDVSELTVLDAATGEDLATLKAGSGLETFEFSPSGKTIVTTERFIKGSLISRTFNAATGELRESHSIPDGSVSKSASGIRVTTIEFQKDHSTITVWDAESGNMLKRLTEIPGKLSRVVSSADLRLIVASYDEENKDNTLFLWNLDAPTFDIQHASTALLLNHACQVLKGEPEYSQVKAECE